MTSIIIIHFLDFYTGWQEVEKEQSVDSLEEQNDNVESVNEMDAEIEVDLAAPFYFLLQIFGSGFACFDSICDSSKVEFSNFI